MPKTKAGEEISWSEFFKRWGEGIKNLTPQQKVNNEFNATIVMLVGFIAALVSLIIFRDKLPITWFTYGLILIFAGNTWSTLIKAIGFYQQKAFFRNIERQIAQGENEDTSGEEEVEVEIKGTERKGMSSAAVGMEKYIVEEEDGDKKQEEK